MPLKKVTFALRAPFGEIGGEWELDRVEQEAAWEMYVELATRVTVVPLGADEGLLREALTSFYTVFGSTREILRRHGPAVAKVPKTADDTGKHSFGYIAAWVLNGAVRPLLARWHPLLEDWEAQRPLTTSRRDHERAWAHHDDLRAEISAVRSVLTDYAWILAQACEAPALMIA
ncbi:MAG: hypothetical protein ACKVZ0_10840, partial [Gemmatimonadales bacterium]